MTTEQQNMVKVIANYANGNEQPYSDKGDFLYKGNSTEGVFFKWEEMPFLTSMDYLHPVAVKVLDDLAVYFKPKSSRHRSNIIYCCRIKPNDKGEYTDLFNATYNAIVFINSQKEGK